MTWLEHHHRSTTLAAAARKLLRRGDERTAERLYEEAAAEAERAMALVPRERHVTFGVIAMIAHRLWRRARRSDDAARVAALICDSPDLFPITVSPQGSATPAPTLRVDSTRQSRRSDSPVL
jgi:hypothetical protein